MRLRIVLSLLLVSIAGASTQAEDLPLASDPHPWIPMRIRDLTLPNGIVMGFLPSPAAPLGKGRLAGELHWFRANNFIATDNVEQYLEQRGLLGSPLSDQDVQNILDLPDDAFLLDGEFGLTQLLLHYGVSNRGHITVVIPHISYSGGNLDSLVEEFHDLAGFSQAGAEFLPPNQFQVIFNFKDNPTAPLVLRSRPTSGGFGDPQILYHHALPQFSNGWRMAFDVGYKPAWADEDEFLGSGNDDFGAQLTLERGWTKNGVVINLSYVFLGEFEQGLDPNDPYAFNATYIRYFGRHWAMNFQGFIGDSLSRDLTDSDFGALETQYSLGGKFYWKRRFIGIGVTENVANFDNTPDIAFHFTIGAFL